VSDLRLERPVMRADARKRLRARLMSEAVLLAEERRARRASPLAWWVARLRPVAVVAAFALALIGGTGVAAAASLPGDPAYPIKRAAEVVELALARSDEQRVQVLAAQTQRRLDELSRAAATRVDKAPTASTEYEAAVERFADAVQELRAAEPSEKHEQVEKVVEAAHDKQVQVLEELKDRVPESAQRGIERAIEKHEELAAPPGKGGERPTRPTASPRAAETPRGGRPSVSPGR